MNFGKVLMVATMLAVASAGSAATQNNAASAEVALDPAALLMYPGTYETSGPVLQITRVGDGLAIGPVGREPLPMRPTSQTEFMVERINTRIVVHAEGGKVDRITLYRGDRVLEGKRVK